MAKPSPAQLTDGALLDWAMNFDGLIEIDPVRFGILAPAQAAFHDLVESYRLALEQAVEPSTRTVVTVAEKNAARDALRADAKRLVSIVDGQANVTDAQRLALGLNVRKPEPTPAPRPTTPPSIEVVAAVGNAVTIRLYEPRHPRRRPEAVIGATVFSFVGAAAPSEEAVWKFEGNMSRPTQVVQFAQSLAPGTRVWFTGFWYNRRAESGPAATPVGANLPGGAAMANAA